MKFVARMFLGLLLMLSPAFGADLGTKKPSANLPIMTAYNWTGFYAGVHAGYAFGKMRQSENGGSAAKRDWNGLTGGATAGYSYQMGQVVLGIEGDVSASGPTRNFSGHPGWGCFAGKGCESKVEWFGTLRGRVGYAFDRFLPYLTGGLAVGQVKASILNSCNDGYCGSKTAVGFAVGGGAEYALTQAWTVKAEYLYVDFGKVKVNDRVNFTVNSARFHVARLGVNYRF